MPPNLILLSIIGLPNGNKGGAENGKKSFKMWLSQEREVDFLRAKRKFVLHCSYLKDVAYHYTRQETATKVLHQENVKTIPHDSVYPVDSWAPPKVYREHAR